MPGLPADANVYDEIEDTQGVNEDGYLVIIGDGRTQAATEGKNLPATHDGKYDNTPAAHGNGKKTGYLLPLEERTDAAGYSFPVEVKVPDIYLTQSAGPVNPESTLHTQVNFKYDIAIS